MKHKNKYNVCYITSRYGTEKEIEVYARNAPEAYELAVWEAIPAKEGAQPYGAYVESVTYTTGGKHTFNNLIGKPY